MSETQEMREQLLEIIATEGMIDRAKLSADATIETIGMASYDMVMIMMAIEEKFGVYLSVDSELTEVKTLEELLTVLATRIEQQKKAATPDVSPEVPASEPAPVPAPQAELAPKSKTKAEAS